MLSNLTGGQIVIHKNLHIYLSLQEGCRVSITTIYIDLHTIHFRTCQVY